MADKGLGGRINRGSRIARTGLKGASGFARARLRRALGDDDPDRVHAELAAQMAEVLGDMKGAAMKLGQLLSFVDVDLPPEVRSAYHEAFASLRDSAPPIDPASVRKVLREEYGAEPEQVFASFDPDPLAAASIGQVHSAKLGDGRDVVVKVQYPGVADAVRSDLRNAEAFAPLGRFFSPNQEIEPLLDELRERIDDELDYQKEAQYQRAFADRYRGHPFIVVPDVVGELSRTQVLVSERIHGRRFDEVASGDDEQLRQRVGEIVFRYAFGSIGRFRLFNGDPHPGNYLVRDDGSVGFIDYGSVKMFTRERYESMHAIESAVIADEREEFLRQMEETGFAPRGGGIDEDALWEWFRLYMTPVLADQPFTFTPEFATEQLRATSDPRSPYYSMLRRLNLPRDYLLLTRIHLGLNSVLGRLGARADWQAIREEYVSDEAQPATELGEQDARWWRERGRGQALGA